MSSETAWAYFNAGNYRAAEREARACLLQNPEDGEAMALIAQCRLATGDKAGARTALAEATAVDPDNPYLWYVTGAVEAAHGLFPNARNAYERAIDLAPDMAPAHAALAYLYDVYESGGNAKRHFETALALDPDNADTLTAYARFLQKRGHPANDTINRALELAPAHPDLVLLLGEIALERGDVTQARERAAWLLSQNAEDRDARQLMIRAAARRNPLIGWVTGLAFWIGGMGMWRQLTISLFLIGMFFALRTGLALFAPVWVHHSFVSLACAAAFILFCGSTIIDIMVERETKNIALRDDF